MGWSAKRSSKKLQKYKNLLDERLCWRVPAVLCSPLYYVLVSSEFKITSSIWRSFFIVFIKSCIYHCSLRWQLQNTDQSWLRQKNATLLTRSSFAALLTTSALIARNEAPWAVIVVFIIVILFFCHLHHL